MLLVLGILAGPARAATGTIAGFVRDAGDGETIAFVEVYLHDRSTGTLTDRTGYYVLDRVPAGVQTVVFSIVGYRTVEQTVAVEPGRARRCDVRLQAEPIPVGSVTISAERQRFQREVDIGVRQLKTRDLKLIPGFIEQDLMKSLQVIPGVVALSDFSSALYVRGGSPDQNLVLLDGVPVYNPYHLGGLFSTFNLDALKNAELRLGAFPADYGNAVSSVLDVELKQGNSERWQARGEVSLLSSRLVVEGPIPRGTVLVAGRRTYIDAFTGLLNLVTEPLGLDVYLPYYFYDLQAKVNLDLSERHRLTFSGFLGDDVIHFDEAGNRIDFRWGNYTVAGRWRALIAAPLVANLLVTASRYRVALAGGDSTGSAGLGTFGLRMGIEDLGIKEDLTWLPRPDHTVRFGIEGKLLNIYNWMRTDTTVLLDRRRTPVYVGAWAADKWQVWPTLLVDAGLRAEYFSSGRYVRVAPRVGAKYFLRSDFALTAGYGHFYQYLSIPFPRNELMMRFPVQMLEQWLPADEQFPPARAIHYCLGAERWLGNDLTLTVEGYYKTMANLLETELPFAWFGDTETDTLAFRAGTGTAWGAELLVRWRDRWLGYSLSRAERTFDGVTFTPVFDARHTVNLAAGMALGKTWNVSAQWIYRSGFPYTGPVGRYQYVWIGPDGVEHYEWIPIDGRRGGFRYPAYHRLDLALEKSFRLFGIRWTASLQVVNVYARRNVMWYDYDYSTEPPRRTPVYMLPIPIPSLGIRGAL